MLHQLSNILDSKFPEFHENDNTYSQEDDIDLSMENNSTVLGYVAGLWLLRCVRMYSPSERLCTRRRSPVILLYQMET